MSEMIKPYQIAALALQKAAALDQLERVSPNDTFARLLLLGKIKALQRLLDATHNPDYRMEGRE